MLILSQTAPEVEKPASEAGSELCAVLPGTDTAWLRTFLTERGPLRACEAARLVGIDAATAARLLFAAAKRGRGVVRLGRGRYAIAGLSLPPDALLDWRHATRTPALGPAKQARPD